ncbi:MAG TPA: cytochrome c oxidase subunit II [Acetobacteraceae bacterium]|nr:cytochrome c oxidase subunit II [Acetobacteraceae bacterium]
MGTFIGSLLASLGLAGSAFAQSKGQVLGVPHDWQMGFPDSYTPVMQHVASLHDLLLVIITLISLFVLALLLYVVFRFHASRNATPSTVTHNTVLEIAWTIIPILILVVIAIPSFRLLYYGDKAPDAAMTVKVTGHQWYWQYEYPDQGNFSIDSRALAEADRVKQKPQEPRMLAVDQEMVIPANTVVRVIGTGADVMHGWTVWGFGIKKTVIPGRLNEGWIQVPQEGLYFGQCSQICGQDHSYMPIVVRVVSKADFDKWVGEKKKAAGLLPATGLASASTTPANR